MSFSVLEEVDLSPVDTKSWRLFSNTKADPGVLWLYLLLSPLRLADRPETEGKTRGKEMGVSWVSTLWHNDKCETILLFPHWIMPSWERLEQSRRI